MSLIAWFEFHAPESGRHGAILHGLLRCNCAICRRKRAPTAISRLMPISGCTRTKTSVKIFSGPLKLTEKMRTADPHQKIIKCSNVPQQTSFRSALASAQSHSLRKLQKHRFYQRQILAQLLPVFARLLSPEPADYLSSFLQPVPMNF